MGNCKTGEDLFEAVFSALLLNRKREWAHVMMFEKLNHCALVFRKEKRKIALRFPRSDKVEKAAL